MGLRLSWCLKLFDISLLKSDINVSDENCLLVILQHVVPVGTIFVLLFVYTVSHLNKMIPCIF